MCFNRLGINYRGQLSLPGSRQASSNASEGGAGGYNRESSLDDSGVVDDHYDIDTTGADLLNASNIEVKHEHRNMSTAILISIQFHVQLQGDVTPVTIALTEREVRIIKCNGNLAKLNKEHLYSLPPEYLSSIVVLGAISSALGKFPFRNHIIIVYLFQSAFYRRYTGSKL